MKTASGLEYIEVKAGTGAQAEAGKTVMALVLAALIGLLVTGAEAKEIAALAGKITGKRIRIPSGYERRTGLALERELQAQLFKTGDAKEGMTSFLEKRKPNFKGC